MSDELDEIRRKRLKELQEASMNRQDNDIRAQQEAEAREAFEAQKQSILRQILSEKAKERLTNVKLVKPALAESIENQLIQLAQSGRLPGGQITEEQLLQLLKQLQGQRRDSSIKFKRV